MNNQQQIIELLKNLTLEKPRITINYCFENFIEHSKLRAREQTIIYYKKTFKVLKETFKNYDIVFIDQLDTSTFEKILGHLKQMKNYSNNTLNKFIDLIKMIIRLNVDREIIAYNKLLNLKKLPKDVVKIETIAFDDIKLIFQYLENLPDTKFNLRNKLFMMLFFETGIRLNELLNIEVKNIDLENNSIFLSYTKSKKSRNIDFFVQTKETLIKYLDRIKPKKYLFINLNNNNQDKMKKITIYNFIDKIKSELNISSNISPHKWRHTLATALMNNNVNMRIIQDVMGHSSLNTTEKYLHIKKDNRKKDLIKSSILL